jgi:hypothetical protein
MAVKVLCHVNHYFGPSRNFVGGSTTAEAGKRRHTVETCLSALRELPNAAVDLRVCGIGGHALVPLDVDYGHLEDPTELVYESLYDMASRVEDYDYFVNIEDDILVPAASWLNVLEFDRTCLVNEILHPNRLEVDDTGFRYCVDLYGNPTWTHQTKRFQGRTIRVAVTPHSGLLIMSRAKLRYALSEIDSSFRGVVFARRMESALAHFHSPFSLYRTYDDPDFHHVLHLDRWKHSPAVVHRANPYRAFHDVSVSIADFVPPAARKAYRFLKRLVARPRAQTKKREASQGEG